jgi:hypothetical protein
VERVEGREPPGDSGVILLFLRLLGLVYFFAFSSLFVQVDGLIGSKGILPAVNLLENASRLGVLRFWILPTLLWLDASDRALKGMAALGAVVGALLTLGVAPLASTALLWLLYLSLTSVGGVFTGYQWDTLLLEAGLLAVFAAPRGLFPRGASTAGRIPRIALRFLLFRLMLGSGLVKLLSGDPTWKSLTALDYHYWTQPLPTWIGWYFAQLPSSFHRVSTLVMFGIEIGCPFFVFGPRKARLFACAGFLLLQTLIALTGNYAFFNLLTVALTILLLDDRLLPKRLRGGGGDAEPPWMGRARAGAAGFLIVVSSIPFLGGLRFPVPGPLFALYTPFEPFRSTNAYGLFAVMTTERLEIEVQGSQDGSEWRPYVFRYKPGDPARPPSFVAPHQPRLDWQMWFAALGTFEETPWFSRFLSRLFEGSPGVLALLERDPFSGSPPRYLRAVLYRYRFASREKHSREGVWWTREEVGPYSPVFEKEP